MRVCVGVCVTEENIPHKEEIRVQYWLCYSTPKKRKIKESKTWNQRYIKLHQEERTDRESADYVIYSSSDTRKSYQWEDFKATLLRTTAFTMCAHVGLWWGCGWGEVEREGKTERAMETGGEKGANNPKGGQLHDEFKSRPTWLITLLFSLALHLGAFCLFKRLRSQLVFLLCPPWDHILAGFPYRRALFRSLLPGWQINPAGCPTHLSRYKLLV